MSEPKPGKEDKHSNPSGKRWASYAITLLVLLAVFVSGTAAYNAREQWWDQYLSFIRR